MRSVLFWDLTLRRMVILYQRLGNTYQCHLKGQEVLDHAAQDPKGAENKNFATILYSKIPLISKLILQKPSYFSR